MGHHHHHHHHRHEKHGEGVGKAYLETHSIPCLTEKDCYVKSHEFSTWLKEYKDKYCEDFDEEKNQKYFKKFMKKYNEEKYYKGCGTSVITKHKWVFKNVDEKKLKSIVNEVENSHSRYDDDAKELGPDIPEKKEKIKKFDQYEYEMQKEREKEELKKSRKEFFEQQKLDYEAIHPKAVTVKEKRNEKRLEMRAEKRAREAEPDDKPVFEDEDDEDTFATTKARLERRREERKQQRQNVLQERLNNYQQKENESMSYYKNLVNQLAGGEGKKYKIPERNDANVH